MSAIFTDTAALALLQALTSNDFTLKLFTNDITPSDTDTAGMYTEALGGGYAAKTLVGGSWSASIVDNIAQTTYVMQIFTFTSALDNGNSIYGYYLVDGSGNLVSARRLVAPYTPAEAGDMFATTPTIRLSAGTVA